MFYNKDSLKESLSIEEIFNLINELGGEPIMQNGYFIAKTICHNHDLTNASHKLYYYDNTHLFHCYTGCGDASFDIYDLILKIHNTNGIENFSLTKAIIFIARYFGYTTTDFNSEEELEISKDWQIINNFNKNKTLKTTSTIEFKYYDDKILTYLPQPHIIPWEQEGISYSIICNKNIHYDPINEGIVIPHYDINGKLIGVRERTLIKENEIYGKYRPAVISGQMYNHPLSFALYNLNWSKENIKQLQKAIVYEGQKSCLKHASYFGQNADISVACCGSNLINAQFSLLYKLGVKEIVIAFDKQFQAIGDKEWKEWTTKLKNIYDKYGSYVKISYLFDKTGDLLQYKSSPIDEGKEKFLQLFTNRITIE